MKTKTEKLTTDILFELDKANKQVESLKEELHTEKNNTFAERVKVTTANKRIHELELWIEYAEHTGLCKECMMVSKGLGCTCKDILKKDSHG